MTPACSSPFGARDLLRDARSANVTRELKDLNVPLHCAVTSLARRLYRRATQRTIQRTVLAVIDIPQGQSGGTSSPGASSRLNFVVSSRSLFALSFVSRKGVVVESNLEGASGNIEIVRQIMNAVRERNLTVLVDAYASDIEIDDAESLPYGGISRAPGHDREWQGVCAHLGPPPNISGSGPRSGDLRKRRPGCCTVASEGIRQRRPAVGSASDQSLPATRPQGRAVADVSLRHGRDRPFPALPGRVIAIGGSSGGSRAPVGVEVD